MDKRIMSFFSYSSLFRLLVLFVLILPGTEVFGRNVSVHKYEETVFDSDHKIKELYNIPYYSGDEFDSIKHKLNLFLPEGINNPPILIWIHGGAWAFGGRKFETELARNFAKEGIAVAVISYRLSPATWKNPNWTEGFQHPAHIQDVARAFSWVYDNAQQYKYDKFSIFVGGYSAGAHLTSLLSMDPTYLAEVGNSVRQIKGVIPIAGAYDLVAYYNSHLKFNGKELADGHVKGVFGNSMNGIRKASPTEFIENQWVSQLVISESDTYDYTKLLEEAALKAEYSTMEFHHFNNENHKSLYNDLSADKGKSKNLILSFINRNRADYSYLQLDGFKLAYKVFGSGKPTFLLNGGPGFSSHNFKNLAQKIAKKTKRQVILFDQRGTGYSEIEDPNSSNISLKLMVEDLEELRKHLGYNRISLIGQSFGGIYTMAYTAKYPDKVSKIVLSHSAGMNMDFMSDVDSRLNQNLSKEDLELLNKSNSIRNPDLSSKIRYKAISSGYVFNKDNKSKVFKGLAFNSRFYPEINRLMWEDMNKNYNVVEAMGQIDKPVLIIHGEHDIVNPVHAKYTHETIANSYLVILKNCVHYGWIDQPEKYFEEVFNFLKTS